ncbi:hypothetical protein HZ992_15900 [Rhizobacter sp. AJA081-3]|uniref:hypothetical protein n=1 Tax=Rhizobacter sp. AJA081-3 TaxID=2753607 RepID=UPI001ADEDFB4|nr:hypothetical protein [Rhizobacter sp. AJA081-3]QTN21657.1 hypothetical protein HZ992_15900 [Rhizobacter sp. AJA081-3]
MTRRLLLALVSALAACSAPQDDSLFPLAKGHRWAYDITTEWENHIVEHEPRVIETLGDVTLDSGRAWRRRSDSGIEYWLRSDAAGIYRVASKSELDEAPLPDKEPRFVLKAPIAVGTTWRASTTAYLLRRRQEFPPEIRHSHPAVPMNYAIEAVGEKLATRAGSFENCVRVKGVAALRLFADPVVGWKDMALTTTEWYCPGVGLAKLLREEPAESTFLTGGKLTMELVEYQ